MDKQIIQTKIPLAPSLINQYCKTNCNGEENILFEFDVSDSLLTPGHMLGYLSNLKIDFRVTGFDDAFFIEYLKTPFMVGQSNLSRLHANLLMWRTQHELPFETITSHDSLYESIPQEVIDQQMQVIKSLPLFLFMSADMSDDIRNPFIDDLVVNGEVFEYVGVNFVHLISFQEVLLKLVSSTLFEPQIYFDHYFDKYIYGGDKLIKFFIDNPDNLLHPVIEAIASRNG